VRRFERHREPRVSVIMLIYASAKHLVAALESLRTNVDPRFPYEVILVANGAPPEVVAAVQRAANGARVIVSDVNLGFGGGCNLGARASAAPYLVFLNDDVLVEPDWLESLVRLADERADAGAIGSRIAFPDGTLQEAGSVIFADGSTTPVGRMLPAASPRWRAVREVDYCSACSLLVRRQAFDEVGGFDTRYHPAYYEDVDLALKLRTAGWRVLYQPRSRLVHLESQSSTSDFKSYLFRRNIETLRRHWAPQLASFAPAKPWDRRVVGAAIRRARRATAHVLVIDDRLPDGGLGSGFGRMAELCRDVRDSRYAISFYPTCGSAGADAVGEFGVEVIDGDLTAWLDDPGTHVDAVLISRPHNWAPFAGSIRLRFPSAPLIYDAEALFHRRLGQLVKLTTNPVLRAAYRIEFENGRVLEQRIAQEADHLVCVSAEEARILREFSPDASIEHMAATATGIEPTTPSFEERASRAVFVAGWMAGPASPNVDALAWFAEHVLPLLAQRVPECEIVVTGANPPAEARRLAGPHLRLVGFVEDLGALYAGARVAVAPIRFGAGVKIKTIEALQYGVPVVATTIGAEGIVLDDLRAIATADDPAAFADALAALLQDRTAWEASRSAALVQARAWADEPRRSWLAVFDEVLERRLSAARASIAARGALLRARDLADAQLA
jgi:GT2 family glycosyltransferase